MKTKLLALFAFVVLWASTASAQVLNCTGSGAPPNRCTAVTDPADPPPALQPVSCKIYNSATGAFVIASGPVSGPPGAVYCAIPLPTIAAGTFTSTATYVLTDGTETGRSNVYTVTVGIPVVPTNQPPPKNHKVTAP